MLELGPPARKAPRLIKNKYSTSRIKLLDGSSSPQKYDMTHRIGLMAAQWAPIRASLRCCRAYSPILHATAFVRPKLVRNAAAVLRYEWRSLSSARKPNTQAPVGSQQAVPASKAVRSIGPKFGE